MTTPKAEDARLLEAAKAALALLTGSGQDGTLGHHPDNPVPAKLRAAIAAAERKSKPSSRRLP